MTGVFVNGDTQSEPLGALVFRPASFGLTIAGLETSAPSRLPFPTLDERRRQCIAQPERHCLDLTNRVQMRQIPS